LHLFLLAQESKPLLSHIHGDDHKQTKHQKKEKKNHAHRIARSIKSVLYRRFTNAKQFCKSHLGRVLHSISHLRVVNMLFQAC
jgi:hypothetical protein